MQTTEKWGRKLCDCTRPPLNHKGTNNIQQDIKITKCDPRQKLQNTGFTSSGRSDHSQNRELRVL